MQTLVPHDDFDDDTVPAHADHYDDHVHEHNHYLQQHQVVFCYSKYVRTMPVCGSGIAMIC